MLETAAAHGFTFDTVQMPVNVMDAHYDSFERRVLPARGKTDTAVLAMKPLGSGVFLKSAPLAAREVSPTDCLRYPMGTPPRSSSRAANRCAISRRRWTPRTGFARPRGPAQGAARAHGARRRQGAVGEVQGLRHVRRHGPESALARLGDFVTSRRWAASRRRRSAPSCFAIRGRAAGCSRASRTGTRRRRRTRGGGRRCTRPSTGGLGDERLARPKHGTLLPVPRRLLGDKVGGDFVSVELRPRDAEGRESTASPTSKRHPTVTYGETARPQRSAWAGTAGWGWGRAGRVRERARGHRPKGDRAERRRAERGRAE